MARNKSSKRIPSGVTGKINIIAVVEGITEKLYFERLKELNYFPQLSFTIKMLGSKDNWRPSLTSALASKNNADYVLLILDIDHDTEKMSEIERLITKDYSPKVLKKVLFYNNYAFELFLLNHKIVYRKSVINGNGYDAEMKKVFQLSSYNKREKEIESIMKKINKEDIDLAVERMSRIVTDYRRNPSSNMVQMFDKLKKIKI